MRKLMFLLLLLPGLSLAATNQASISGGYSKTQTVLTVPTAEMTKVPDPAGYGAYPATFYNKTFYTNPTTADLNYEIVKIVGKSSATAVTVQRAQSSTTAKSVPTNTTWNMQLRFATGFATATPTATAVPPTNTFTPTNTGTPTATFTPTITSTPTVTYTPTTVPGTAFFSEINAGNFTTGPATDGSLVMFVGDSLTNELYNGTGTHPSSFITIGVNYTGVTLTTVNTAVSGWGVTTCMQHAASLWSPYVRQYGGLKIAVFWLGTNDFISYVGGSVVAQRIRAGCEHLKAMGFNRIIVASLQSRNGADFEDARQVTNTYLRAEWSAYADELVDLGADPYIGCDDCYTDTTYYSDGLHFTDAGYTIAAALFKTAIERVITREAYGDIRRPYIFSTLPTVVPREVGDRYYDTSGPVTAYEGICTNSVTCWRQTKP